MIQITAIKYSAVAAVALFALLLSCGCGSGSSQSAEAVEWKVARQLTSRKVKLVASVKYCGGERYPALKPSSIRYNNNKVLIKMVLSPQPEADSEGGCLLQLLGITKTITLKRNLENLVLFDASTDPPERRWPSH